MQRVLAWVHAAPSLLRLGLAPIQKEATFLHCISVSSNVRSSGPQRGSAHGACVGPVNAATLGRTARAAVGASRPTLVDVCRVLGPQRGVPV